MFKIILPGTAMIGVTYAFARFSFGLFLPEISTSLHLTESRAGIIGTIGYIAYSLALICANLFISKHGQLKVVQASGISAVGGLIGIALSTSFWSLAISSFVAGLGSGWISPAFSQVAETTLPSNMKDKGNSWMNTGTSFGVMVSGPIALLFTSEWRLAFVFFGLLSFIVLIWNSLAIPNKSTEIGLKKTPSLHLSILVKKGRFLLSSSLLIGLSSAIYWTFGRSYLVAIHEWNSSESVLFWILMGISGVGGSIAGSLIQNKGLRFSYRLTLLFLILSIILITVPVNGLIYVSGILFGITYIAMTGILLVWGTRLFSYSPYLGVSLSFLFLGIGQTVGSTLGGYAIEYFSYPMSFFLFSLIGLCGLFIPTSLDSL